MKTFDTNLWVRYLTNDDQLQARRALALLEQTDAAGLGGAGGVVGGGEDQGE